MEEYEEFMSTTFADPTDRDEIEAELSDYFNNQ